jgi:ribosome biogenesis GTPase A
VKKNKSGRQIHWYPGHMAGATRELQQVWRHIDVVLEVGDARIPGASRNPLFLELSPRKPHLLVLSHADLADQEINRAWLNHFREEGLAALACDLRDRSDLTQIRTQLLKLHQPFLEKAKKQGRIARPLRVLVAGIPNTGKSTLINQLVGKRSAKVEARPGVTRSLNWLRSGKELHLLDSPGILPAKMADKISGLYLASTGAIRDSILPLEEVAVWLFDLLYKYYGDQMSERYGPLADFEAAALRTGCLLTDGQADLTRFASRLLDDYRSGRIGRMTLERPDAGNSHD